MNNFLAITYAFMLAYCPEYGVSIDNNTEAYREATHTSFQLGVEVFDCVHIYCGEETYQLPNGSIFSWKPFTQAYWLGAEYRKSFNGKVKLSTGIRHKCQHPLNPCNGQLSHFDQSNTELYVGIEGKVDIF